MPDTEPMNTNDITDAELLTIYAQVQAAIERSGLPTDAELRQEIESMNAGQPVVTSDDGLGQVLQPARRAGIRQKPVLVCNNGEILPPPVEPTYEDHEQMQAWLERLRASLIREGALGEAPARWMSVFTAPYISEFVDHAWQLRYVLVDEDGVPTFVHRKLPLDKLGLGSLGFDLTYMVSNGVSFWNTTRLRGMFDLWCSNAGTTPEQALEDALGHTASASADEFWQRVAWNLQKRRIRLIFTAWTIAPEVKELVEFLNSDMKTVEILAAEVR